MPRRLAAKFMIGITAIVVALLFFTIMWAFSFERTQAEKDLLAKADLVAKQQQVTRSFMAQNQGTVVHGSSQKGMAPSDMGKAVDEMFADVVNSRVKQTRLVVRDGKNEPDEFERKALLQFAEDPGLSELHERVQGPDGPEFRYIIPLRADTSCLSCHGEPAGTLDQTGHLREGMRQGDLAGAISVTLTPITDVLQATRSESIRMAIGVLIFAAISLALIWIIFWKQVSVPLQQLATVASSIGGSNLRVEPDSLRLLQANEETAVVADAFQAMSTRLQELYTGLEQKVAERTEQLQTANHELERASRLKSEFLTMISHEFRTPLTSIITFTELLLDDAAGKLNVEQQDYLTDVLESSNQLLHMISDLLDLSRLEAGKMNLFLEALDFADLARDAERTVRPLAEKKGISLGVRLLPNLPLVHADGLRVTQVLLNLLGNAVKFTDRGSVTVSTRVDGDFLEVAVTDTGVGIAREDQATIFEAFRQSGRQRPEGSGLGLALARSLIELHSGRIWLDSELGKGSSFYFTLPLWFESGRPTNHVDSCEADSRSG